MAEPTHEQLSDLCALWQRRLELQDWHVAVRYGRARDVEGDG